jgi:hypothetical protein
MAEESAEEEQRLRTTEAPPSKRAAHAHRLSTRRTKERIPFELYRFVTLDQTDLLIHRSNEPISRRLMKLFNYNQV